MEIEKVYDGAQAKPVDDIADRTADDQANGYCEERRRRAAQPKDQDRDDHSGGKRKDERVQPRAAVEQSETDAAIVGQGNIEERRHRLTIAKDTIREEGENRRLAELVENHDD